MVNIDKTGARGNTLRNNVLSWMISAGLVLLVVHNPDQPLLKHAFLPQVGMALLVIGALFFIADNYRNLDIGSKWLYIPLLVIVASMAASATWQYAAGNTTVSRALGVAAFGAVLFCVYVAARGLGRGVLRAFPVLVVVEAISLVAMGLVRHGLRTGGIVGPSNYDIATGALILGVLLSPVKHQWWLSAVALVGLLFTGAEEALVAGAVLGVAWLVRRDFGKRVLLPASVLVIAIVALLASGRAADLYQPTVDKLQRFTSLVSGERVGTYPITNSNGSVVEYPRTLMYTERGRTYEIYYSGEWEEALDNATNWRWTQYKQAAQRVAPFGHGYEMLAFDFGFVHNVPLIIVDQVGPPAAVAWIFVTVLCLVRYRMKYLFIAIVALSLFDHYTWTQVAPWWWVAVGIASVSTSGDLMFRRDKT